jgi:hypothetical protein
LERIRAAGRGLPALPNKRGASWSATALWRFGLANLQYFLGAGPLSRATFSGQTVSPNAESKIEKGQAEKLAVHQLTARHAHEKEIIRLVCAARHGFLVFDLFCFPYHRDPIGHAAAFARPLQVW